METSPSNFKVSSWDLFAMLICVSIACLLCWKIISHGIIYAADDIWWHVLWLKEFTSELNEGIIYPRWLGQCNYHYGSPTFVFYPPLCFYLGALLQKITQLNAMSTTTALFALGTFSCGFSFYLCGLRRWGKRAALAGAVMLMTAPFITLDIFFRASLAELFALTWLPLILLNVDAVNHRAGRNLLALGFCMLALTHVPSLLIYSVTWLARLTYCTIKTNGGGKRLGQNVLYASLGLGCAALFLVPMLAEQKYVNIAAILDRHPWEANLLLSKNYSGYFPIPDLAIKSTAVALIEFLIIVGSLRFRRRGWLDLKEPVFWVGASATTFLLMSDASSWLWQNIRVMQFLQFPWRLMTVNIFSAAVLLALCVKLLPAAKIESYLKLMIGSLLIVFVVQHLSADYFLTKYRSGLDSPEAYMTMDSRALKVDEFARYEMPKLLDGNDGYPGTPEYTPLIGTMDGGIHQRRTRTVIGQPMLSFVDGAGTVKVTELKSYKHLFTTDARDHVTFKMRTYFYPAWHLYIDGKETQLSAADDGQMLIHAPAGKHSYELRYQNTPAFDFGIWVSALSISLLAWLNMRHRGLRGREETFTPYI